MYFCGWYCILFVRKALVFWLSNCFIFLRYIRRIAHFLLLGVHPLTICPSLHQTYTSVSQYKKSVTTVTTHFNLTFWHPITNTLQTKWRVWEYSAPGPFTYVENSEHINQTVLSIRAISQNYKRSWKVHVNKVLHVHNWIKHSISASRYITLTFGRLPITVILYSQAAVRDCCSKQVFLDISR